MVVTAGNPAPLYFLFFCSGLSSLIYQIVWVRVFGNVFGNTLYSTSIVVAVFMLGLGVGSYVAGLWADRCYAALSDIKTIQPQSIRNINEIALLRTYAFIEAAIALLGLAISLLLPHLVRLSSAVSSYTRGTNGWYELATSSHIERALIATILLLPITLLMGGTLTVLIRHLVRKDPGVSGRRIALLYGINTIGAAVGCALTDLALVPTIGLWATQMVAVFFNLVAAIGALGLTRPSFAARIAHAQPAAPSTYGLPKSRGLLPSSDGTLRDRATLRLANLALALSGFSAMGMEIVWFRHFSILLGGFRAVFALLLAVILIGIGVGSVISASLTHGGIRTLTARDPFGLARAACVWMAVQGLFVASTLAGLSIPDPRRIDAAAIAGAGVSGVAHDWVEMWFNLRPILFEVGVPALLMGVCFPLANALVQHAEHRVGRCAGLLYLSNTVGAVCGSLVAGFVLLPTLGIQSTATLLMTVTALAIVTVYLAARDAMFTRVILTGALVVAIASISVWLLLPSDYLMTRAHASALSMQHDRLLTLREGLTEVIAITETPGKGRRLLTDGHPMSATTWLAQRYMRALAHIPLLAMDRPETILVIGFGVGNTVHAATLHPSVRRVEVADLSTNILSHAHYFSDVNMDAIGNSKVVVYVNDGRHHLQMRPVASYDLITLEPPPIAFAGVASLYSTEFYALARTRLKPKGYISQWLPAYQVPIATTLAMIRAFIDVFPQAVLLSGAKSDLLLVGVNDSRIEIDPDRVTAALVRAPAVQSDLKRLDLGSVPEIIGTFMASAKTLDGATREVMPASDDRPIQEYAVRSLLDTGGAVPESVVDLHQLGAWCPNCFSGGSANFVSELDTYLALLDLAYSASPEDAEKVRSLAERRHRIIDGSAYLGEIVPDSAHLHDVLGVAFAGRGRFEDAITEFRQALQLDPNLPVTYRNLGAALASHGEREEGIDNLRRAVELDPANAQTRYELASTLLDARKFNEAVDQFRVAIRLMPSPAKAYNNLGIALASQGKFDEAIEQFQNALALDPNFPDARRNLAAVRQTHRTAAP